MLFLKRLEDDGSMVHINTRDKEMIEMFQKASNPHQEYHDQPKSDTESDLQSPRSTIEEELIEMT